MSKIEIYKEAKSLAYNIRRDVEQCLGKDSATNDKHRIGFEFNGIRDTHWPAMIIGVVAKHGYYGSSSAYNNANKDLGPFLARAMQEKAVELFERAAELAESDAEAARLAAEGEAQEVLKATS